MAEIVNLNKYRKEQIRRTREQEAAANRARFGRRKDEAAKDRDLRERAGKDLDDKRLDEPPGSAS